jgi:phosphoserine phosphatase
MREPQGGVLAVDLDGTIVGINTFPHFVRFLTRSFLQSRRVVPLGTLVGAGVLRKARLLGHRDLKRVVCRLGAELPEREVRDWAAGVLDRHARPEVVEIIRGWQGRAVMTTAAPEVYAVHLADLLGIPEVHGSRVVGGVLVNNEGAEKCVRLRAAGLDRVDVFLTDDTVIDLPMARLADRVYEVLADGRVIEFRVESVAPGPA